MERFTAVVEQYMGKKFQPFKPMPEWKFEDYLGWHEQVGRGRGGGREGLSPGRVGGIECFETGVKQQPGCWRRLGRCRLSEVVPSP